MKLYLVHLGFYDEEVGQGLYENHINVWVVAESFQDAKRRAKKRPEYARKKMHVDGIAEIEAVDGFRIGLTEVPSLHGGTVARQMGYKELEALSAN